MHLKRILLDCTETYTYNLNTGIQRVVRNIVDRKHIIEKELNIEVLPVVLTMHGYVKLEDFLKNKSQNIDTKAKDLIKGFIISEMPYIYDIAKNIWRLYKKLNIKILSPFKKSKDIIIPNDNELLFLIDAFWDNLNMKNDIFLNILKANKPKIGVLIHDITPITNPEFFEDNHVKIFKKAMDAVLPRADFIITISKTEENIIKDYLKSISLQKPISYFYHGSDFSKSQNTNIRDKILDFKNKKYFLMVGTIEPRKGHKDVLEVFERLWSNGFEDNLIIVGKIGWNVEDLVKKITSSGFYNKKLFMINDASDQELDYLYTHTKGLIFASKREGFGLPLIEAMHKNIPVIARDIEIFREIAKDYPIYFKELEDLKNILINFDKYEFKPTSMKVFTWDDSVRMLCDRLKDMIK